MNTQLAVIGAGPGGYAAAFLAADLGMQVTLVDKDSRLGGCCLLRGCIPSKALLHVAKTMAEAKHLAGWGVTYAEPTVELGTINLDTMRAQKEKVIDTLAGGLKQLSARRNVRVIRARATFEDSQTVRLEPVGDGPLDEDRVRFDHCILATGSSPVPLTDRPMPRVMDSTGALALGDVPASMLVVGGGYIGLELGTVYAALGTRVSVVELTDGLLPGVDRDLVRPLHKRLETDFEAIYLRSKVVQIDPTDGAVEVKLEGDAPNAPNAPEAIERFDRVLSCVGRRPNSEGLGLENTRVELDGHGFVEVDQRQRTADRHVLAVGDVAGQPMLAHKATHQGKVAAESLAGEAVVFRPRAVPAVVFTDPEIAWAGLTETEAKQQGRRVRVARFPWAASGRAQAVGRTEGSTKWLIDAESDRLLGCGIVGPGAGELIAEAVLAIELGAAVRDLTGAIHPHPTLSETLSAAAEVHLGTATELYRPKGK
jgi:dihydrolipoamide dehydrogenase